MERRRPTIHFGLGLVSFQTLELGLRNNDDYYNDDDIILRIK
jgi:hypothetical protein